MIFGPVVLSEVKNKDLIRILEKSCDTMSPKQLKALVDTIDLALEAFANRSDIGI